MNEDQKGCSLDGVTLCSTYQSYRGAFGAVTNWSAAAVLHLVGRVAVEDVVDLPPPAVTSSLPQAFAPHAARSDANQDRATDPRIVVNQNPKQVSACDCMCEIIYCSVLYLRCTRVYTGYV